MKSDELIVFYGTDYKEMTKALLREADLAGCIADRKLQIGIKPNLVSMSLPSQGATTHTEVIAGLIEYLKGEGFEKLVVLESSWVGEKTMDVFSFCGYDRLLDELQVPFWDMQKDRGVSRDCSGVRLNICERVEQIDFLINVPVLKGHCQTKITCALKNMKGLIPNAEKRRFHRMGLHKPIAHLNTGIHQDFILTDSICGDLTFEDGGNPVQQDRLIAGRDPVLVDTYGCTVIGLDPHSVGYIGLAEQLGAGSTRLRPENIHVFREICRGNEEHSGSRYIPDPSDAGLPKIQEGGYRRVMKLAEKVDEVESCSACYGYLLPALDQLEKEGLLRYLKTRICIGQGNRGKEGELGVGSCTAHFCHSLEGCPPTEGQMYEFLKNYITGSAQLNSCKKKT